MHTKIQKDVIQLLSLKKCVSSAYDLWMTRKTEEVFSIQTYYKMGSSVYNSTHLGMPHSTKSTLGVQLAVDFGVL